MGITYERMVRARFPARHIKDGVPKDKSNKANKIARVIANALWDTETNQALLQPWVNTPGNEEHLKGLKENSVKQFEEDLRKTVEAGGCVYMALDEGKIVGAVLVLKLKDDIKNIQEPEKASAVEKEGKKPTRQPNVTDHDWSKQLDQWGTRNISFRRLCYRVGVNLQAHMDEHQSKLWRISSLAVEGKYRNRGIEKTLLQDALSEIPHGDVVYLLAEPGATKVYEGVGFALTKLTGHRHAHLEVPREKGKPRIINIPVMTLKKNGPTKKRAVERECIEAKGGEGHSKKRKDKATEDKRARRSTA